MIESRGTNGEQYSPLFHELFNDSRLKASHIAMYGLIWSKCQQYNGETYVGNVHFQERMKLQSRAITTLIGHLEACGYVARWYDYEGGKKTKRFLKVLGTHQNADREDQIAFQCAEKNQSVCRKKPISMQKTADNIDKLNRYNNIDKGDESPKEVIKEKPKKKVRPNHPDHYVEGTVEKVSMGFKYFDFKPPTQEEVYNFYKKYGEGLNRKVLADDYIAKCEFNNWTCNGDKDKIHVWPLHLNRWIKQGLVFESKRGR